MPLNILVEELILMAATGVSEETTEDSSRSSFPRDDGGFFFPRHQACLA
jgi:hypothetical protein